MMSNKVEKLQILIFFACFLESQSLFSFAQSHNWKMTCQIFRIGRILLQAVLLGIFFHFFGLPAIERFEAREVRLLLHPKGRVNKREIFGQA